jgi:plastocyanin
MKKNVWCLLVAVLACLQYQAALQAAVVDVSMVSFAFEPRDVTINVGDTVRWTNTA